MELWQLRQRQSLPLEAKIIMSQRRIREWYEHWDGQVYVSFSGGKDSTVLLSLVRELYPNVPAVFVDTGLEYPEIREFVKTVDNVVWLRPKMTFAEVIQKYGYPVISKEQSQYIEEIRATKSEKLRKKRLYGKPGDINKKQLLGKIAECNKFLINAPFKISDKCCKNMKKNPFKEYEKNGYKMFTGEMARDSRARQRTWLANGCNAFEIKRPKSAPLSFWMETDIWEYIHTKSIPYSKIYDMGYTRTGCMFCMFGVHREPHPNRFERMKYTHPTQWEYCMFKLGLAEVLDYIGVPWGGQMEIWDYPGVMEQ